MDNNKLAEFCKSKIGIPYVLGTNGKLFTKSMYDDLVRRNPSGWFTAARLPAVKGYIGQKTTDCHGLVEWFVREQSGQTYDTTADGAFRAATVKGSIGCIPELPGVCVRYKGHVGIYIGGGYVVEARGFDYGVCETKLSARPWTEWYKHPKIQYPEGRDNVVTKVKRGMTAAQIQQALDKGGYVLFEKAVYVITKTLRIKGNTVLNLNGATLRQGGRIDHILLTDSDRDTVGYSGMHNVEIYGGTLEGMGKYGTELNLLTLCHAANVHIHDMIFLDVVGFHHIEINSSSGVKVEDCRFEGYHSIPGEKDFRECIQIDHAAESALVVVPTGSAWYDGTCCENVVIRGCTFRKSGARPAPSQCIGNHCQIKGGQHRNIVIENNVFAGGNQGNPSGVCVNLVGMENVVVRENEVSEYGRGVRVYSYDKSYTKAGKKIQATGEDGICRNVLVAKNRISKPSGTYKSSGVWVSAANGRHGNVTVRDNLIGESGGMKYAVDVNHCDGGYVSENQGDGLVKVGNTCDGVILVHVQS